MLVLGFSLPTQRCFDYRVPTTTGEQLFSAYAEVFPQDQDPVSGFPAFLCLRRGVSDLDDFVRQLVVLFSAYAEVFLDSGSGAAENAAFLCLRRGVSIPKCRPMSSNDFSLPTQRCFQRVYRLTRPDFLFSAYAEVFPRSPHRASAGQSFLCLRRGVSSARL